jgi:ribosomal protein S12 methylthiotransferase
MLRVGMISLGCAKNLVDGEVMLGRLAGSGVQVTADPVEADVVIVNTCGFITSAKQESIEAILEVAQARRSGRIKRLIVAGCMVQAYARELAEEIPEIDSFVGLDELEQVVGAVRGQVDHHIPDQRAALKIYGSAQPRVLSTGGFAYLKVSEGCDNPCAFCHIPAMRGRYRSRTPEDLVHEAKNLERAGVKELVLIAQDTTRYGEDLGIEHGLRRLVEALLKETHIPWIRFMYAYPATLDYGLFRLMAREPRFLPYLDIPFQHASRRVLQRMHRGGDARAYASLIDEARGIVPELVVRTTMMVGFPGEGPEEFDELLDFVQRVRFDHLGVFTYSWQEENPGASLGDPIPENVKIERRDRLMEAQAVIALEKNRTLIGKRRQALVCGPLEEMELLTEGRLARQAPETDGRLLINDGSAPAGSLVEVEITEAHPYDVIGRIVAVIEKPGGDAGPLRIVTGRGGSRANRS